MSTSFWLNFLPASDSPSEWACGWCARHTTNPEADGWLPAVELGSYAHLGGSRNLGSFVIAGPACPRCQEKSKITVAKSEAQFLQICK